MLSASSLAWPRRRNGICSIVPVVNHLATSSPLQSASRPAGFLLGLIALLGLLLTPQPSRADAKPPAGNPLEAWLQDDGTLDPGKGFTGSLDLSGWKLLSAENGKPRFVKGDKGGPVLFGTGAGVWDDRFSLPGVDGVIYAVAVVTTNVYIGGSFSNAGGVTVQNLARWDGFGWNPVGGGVDGEVRALTVDGANLWVGGRFSKAGTTSAGNLATWNEANKSWTVPDAGIDGTVRAILIVSGKPYVGGEFDRGIMTTDDEGAWVPAGDGVEGSVYALALNNTDILVGGEFTSTGGGAANNIARLQSTNWFTLGAGVDGAVHAIAIRATNAVLVGGTFANAGSEKTSCLARWDGKAWAAVTAVNGPPEFRSIDAMQVRGGDVYVGGDFDATSGGIGNHVLKYDGTNWATLAAGVNANVYAFATNGAGLFVGGEFQQAGGLVARGFAFWSDTSDLQKVGTNLNGYVSAVFVASDNEVYVGGEFTRAGATNVSRIARWNGTNWFSLADGVGGSIKAIASSGSELFVGGTFTNAGSVAATNLARWNGVAWAAVGDGFNGPVHTLAVVGTTLIAGGAFTQVGSTPVAHIARWDGTAWAPLGAGLNDTVESIVVRWNDIHAGGAFTASDTTPLNHIARWDGRTWVALGEGVDGPVSALALTGSGDLVVGGRFAEAGAIRGANNIARWDGTNWSLLGIGLNGSVRTLHVMDGEIFAGGSFNNAGGLPVRNIARWIEANQAWTLLINLTNNGVDGNVFTVASSRTHVYVGGIFTATGGITNLTRIPRTGWITFGNGLGGTINTLATRDANVFVGGQFSYAGGVVANNIARWTGNNWTALGPGLNGNVNAVVVGQDGHVYAGGAFTNAGGVITYRVARWDGFRWNALGIGLDGPVLALAVQGTNLIAGGEFTRAGGFSASRIARWDGTRWSAIGTGCNDRVRAIAVGTNGMVYAAGDFTQAGGNAANHVACWDGSRWTALGSAATNGVNDTVLALTLTTDGLYAGGKFTAAGGRTNIAGVAFWDGSSWLILGQGLTSTNGSPIVRALAATPGGGLFAAGEFHKAGGSPANFLARWDKSSWAGVGIGLGDPAIALAARGRELFVGGDFVLAGGKASYHFAHWTYTSEAPVIYFRSPGVGDVFTAPALIPLGADAFDLDGVVTKVEFLSGTNVLGVVTNAPYDFAWTNVPPGTYTLTARATDNEGLATGTSALLAVVSSNRVPYIALLSPATNTTNVAPIHLGIIADARDVDGSIRRVDLLAGTNLIGSLTAAPYSFVWTNVPPGTYQLTARAVDNGGGTSTSAPVRVVILPAVPARLAPVILPDGRFALTATGAEGHPLIVETSTDLIQWTPLSTNVVINGTIQFEDPELPTTGHRFYRAVDRP